MRRSDKQTLLNEAGELANLGQFKEAGRLILSRIQVTPDDVAQLDSKERKLVYLAATYFSKADSIPLAVELFAALGERERAADLLEQSGDLLGAKRMREEQPLANVASDDISVKRSAVGGVAVTLYQAEQFEREGNFQNAIQAYFQLKRYADAGRILRRLKRFSEAANMYVEGGFAYEAAACYLEAGDTGKGLDNLIRVPRNHPKYRKAAQHAARIAARLNVLSFELENFLTEFLRAGPKDRHEIETYSKMSQLYERHNLIENATEVLKKILAVSANHPDAARRLESLSRFSKASPVVYEKILEQDASFQTTERRSRQARNDVEEPVLPGLPPLPNLQDFLPANPDPKKMAFEHTLHQNFSPVQASQEMTPEETPPPNKEESVQAEDDFVVGNTIQNRYHLDKEIGRGGMAVVFKAMDTELDEEIALKVFLQHIADPQTQAEALGRFKQELKLSRQLTHQNIIRLYDIGMHRGHRYISMELLEGSDLESRLNGPMDFAQGLSILEQICHGLQAAHDKGVVHRDIKPENLFITVGNLVKVMDFGIAKNTFQQGLTIEGMTAGTPHYMAPEQIASFSEVTFSADLYSLGIVAYRMFTGILPFDAEELHPLMMMQIGKTPLSPKEHNPNIPDELTGVILRLLEKKPENRFQSARELAAYLRRVRKNLK